MPAGKALHSKQMPVKFCHEQRQERKRLKEIAIRKNAEAERQIFRKGFQELPGQALRIRVRIKRA